MMLIDKDQPVLVTGATGYVAGRLIERLLDVGLDVRAAVRDPNAMGKRAALDALAEKSEGSIAYFQSDLLAPGSYAEAMKDCAVVFHTASPFKIDISDPRKELIDPALEGTRNVLEQANLTPSVQRVILTSSCAAIYGDCADLAKTPRGVFDESIWNTTSSLTHNPYAFSKTLAEKEAWAIAEKQERWKLITINPSLVIGPGIRGDATSESFRMVKQLGDGSMKSGAPRFGFGVVDARDVAEAHFKAAFTPEARGRYVISAHDTDLLEMGLALLEKYGDAYPIPRKPMPKWLVWLVAPMVNKSMTRKMVTLNVDHPWRADSAKSVAELGMTYRPMKPSMEEMFQQLIDTGAL